MKAKALWIIAIFAACFVAACAGTPSMVNYESQGSRVAASIYRPAETTGLAPGVLVLHTSGGFSRHEEDVAARLAKEGYVTMTMPYMASGVEGTALFADPKSAEKLARMEGIILDGLKTLRAQPGVDGTRIGAVGYSLGGYFIPILIGGPEDYGIKAAVIYYGVFDKAEQMLGTFRAPLLILQGDNDKYKNFLPRSREIEALAKGRGKSVELVVYHGAMHQFDFEYLRDRYDRKADEDAWRRTVDFLNKYLKK